MIQIADGSLRMLYSCDSATSGALGIGVGNGIWKSHWP
jgi:hypothetical protein